MKKSEFIVLHANLRIKLPTRFEVNLLDSDTDPTQDIPIKAIQLNANGMPLNVRNYNGIFSGVRIEDFTSIEKRNNDQFDNLGELQNLSQKVSKKGVSTTYEKPKGKHLKKYEL